PSSHSLVSRLNLRGVEATVKFATAAPDGVNRSSGSAVRLPTTVMMVSPAKMNPPDGCVGRPAPAPPRSTRCRWPWGTGADRSVVRLEDPRTGVCVPDLRVTGSQLVDRCGRPLSDRLQPVSLIRPHVPVAGVCDTRAVHLDLFGLPGEFADLSDAGLFLRQPPRFHVHGCSPLGWLRAGRPPPPPGRPNGVAVRDGRSTGSGWSGFGFAVGDEPAGFVPAHGFVITGGVDHRGTSTKSDRFRS